MSATMEALKKAMQAAQAAQAVSQKRKREADEAEARRLFNEQQGRNAAERLAREQQEADMRIRQTVSGELNRLISKVQSKVQDQADDDEVISILGNELGPLTRRSPLMSASSKLDTPINLAPGLFFGPHNFTQEYRFGPNARGFKNPISAPLAYSANITKDYWRKGLWRVKDLKLNDWWTSENPGFRSQSQTKRVKAYNLYTNWLMDTVGHIPERIMNTARIASVDDIAMRNPVYGFGIGLGTHAPNYGRAYVHLGWFKRQRDYQITIMQETVNSIKSFVQRRRDGISKRRLSLVKEVQRADRNTRGYRDIIQQNFRFEFTGGRGRSEDFVTMFYPPQYTKVANTFYKTFNEMFGRGYTLTMRAMPRTDIILRHLFAGERPDFQNSMLNKRKYETIRSQRLIDGTIVPLAKPRRSREPRLVYGFEQVVNAVYKEWRRRGTA
jgi:hypothetical protein